MKIHPVKKTDIAFMAELHRIHRDRVRRAKAALATANKLQAEPSVADSPEARHVRDAQGALAYRLSECEAVYKAFAALVRQAEAEGLVELKK